MDRLATNDAVTDSNLFHVDTVAREATAETTAFRVTCNVATLESVAVPTAVTAIMTYLCVAVAIVAAATTVTPRPLLITNLAKLADASTVAPMATRSVLMYVRVAVAKAVAPMEISMYRDTAIDGVAVAVTERVFHSFFVRTAPATTVVDRVR